MSMFRSFINAQSNLTAQARRAFSTTLYGGANKNACVNPEMLYLQPRWHVKKEQASSQGTGKVLVGMIQKRWNSASAQPVELVSCLDLYFLPASRSVLLIPIRSKNCFTVSNLQKQLPTLCSSSLNHGSENRARSRDFVTLVSLHILIRERRR